MKAFLIDLTKCVGCHDCQIGCKDEHCDQAWLPYAEAEPEVGQFWLKLKQFERGAGSHVRVTYMPTLCNHCENAPCMAAAKDGAVYRRDDGLVIIDPVKSKGQRPIMEACPYHCVYWNDALDIPVFHDDQHGTAIFWTMSIRPSACPAASITAMWTSSCSAKRPISILRAPKCSIPSTAPSRACSTAGSPRSSSPRRCMTPRRRKLSRTPR